MSALDDLDSTSRRWLELFRGVVEEQRALLSSLPRSSERSVVVGEGAGGDPTLAIDASAERSLLDALDRAPHPVAVVTEEKGEIGDAQDVLLVDPLDGSYNAQRLYPAYAFSIALAHGSRVGHIELAYVFDLATGDEFIARRGVGAWHDGERMDTRGVAENTEIVAFESVEYDPHELAATIDAANTRLGSFRTRIVGSTALALCYCASARVDAVVSSGVCRIIDFAAAQLIAREAGLIVVSQTGHIDAIGFDLKRIHRVHAARSERTINMLRESVSDAGACHDGA